MRGECVLLCVSRILQAIDSLSISMNRTSNRVAGFRLQTHTGFAAKASRVTMLGLVLGCGLVSGLAGCANNKQAANPVPVVELPAHAAANAALAPFSFMTGTWVGVNPNKTVNEETWSLARGNNMVGTFRQIRRDGTPAFFEVSLVTVEESGIELRLRHMHRALEVPETRKNISIFKLKEAVGGRVEFTGTGDAEQVTGVVYRKVDDNTLAVDISFAPTSKEKGFTSTYKRVIVK